MFHRLGNLLSPPGERAKLIILLYHRTLAAPDPMLHDAIDAEVFKRHVEMLAREFTVLPLGEACRRLACGRLPSRAVSITFDDGYADNEQIALPILERYGVRATFFIATGFSAGGLMFNDGVIEAVRRASPGQYRLSFLGLGAVHLHDAQSRRAAAGRVINALKYRSVETREDLVEQLAAVLASRLPRDMMMTAAQIARLHDRGMEVGAHTVHHPILASLDETHARNEIVAGKRVLEEITGAPVTLFAYPNGKPGRDYADVHVRLVREAGFAAAVSTISGSAHGGSDMFQLPRFGPWDRDARRLGARLVLQYARAAAARPSSRRGDRERAIVSG